MKAVRGRIFLASVLVVGPAVPAEAQDTTTFLIVAAAGYGIEDCLGQGGECGQVVADAWCQVHGQGAALRYGPEANDAAPSIEAASYFITCAK